MSDFPHVATLGPPTVPAVNAVAVSESALHIAASAWLDSAVPATLSPWPAPAESRVTQHGLQGVDNDILSTASVQSLELRSDRGSLVAYSAMNMAAPIVDNTIGLSLNDVSIPPELGRSFDVPVARLDASFPDDFQFSPVHLETGPENDLWVSCLNELSEQGYGTPYQFFTTGFESLPAPPSLNMPVQLSADLSTSAQITDRTRQKLHAAMQGLEGAFKGPVDSQGQLSIPERHTLDRYWRMFWGVPSKNLPFLHEGYINPGDAPAALILAVLADGAMYCGDKHVGMAFFECSRRLVTQYMDTVGSGSTLIPLWLVQTLLTNCVFGLPGGDAPNTDLTVGGLDCLLVLASRVGPAAPLSSFNSPYTVEEEWRNFIEAESRKR